MNSVTIHRDFQKMDFHNYVNKEIAFVSSNDIMRYARGNIHDSTLVDGAPEIRT